MLTTTDILALAPGPALDEAIARYVFQQSGALPERYSTDETQAAKIFDRLPLFVSRPEKPKDPGKPWIAGTLAADPSSSTWHTTLTVTGPTMLGVLCRAALLVAIKAPPPPAPESKSVPAVGSPAIASTKRAASRRPNGTRVGTKTPLAEVDAPKPTQRPAQPIRQPSIFLGSRSKLAPMPKRKPFSMPGDPAK